MQYEKEQLLSISKAGKVCVLCGQPLDDQKHLSMLAPRDQASEGPGASPAGATDPADSQQNGGGAGDSEANLIRTDYHQECWQKVAKADYLSFWLARRPKPPETPKMSKKERNVALTGLFSALMKSQDPIDDPAKFVLSHLLMKYRALQLAGSRVEKSGRKWILFTLPQTEEEFEIPDLRLSDDQVAQTLARITEYLETVQAESTIVAQETLDTEGAEAP